LKPKKVVTLKNQPLWASLTDEGGYSVIDSGGIFRVLNNKFEVIGEFKNKLALIEPNTKNYKISPCGKYAIFVDSTTEETICFNIEQNAQIAKYEFSKPYIINYDAEFKYLILGCYDGKVGLFRAKSGEFVKKFPSHPDYVACAAFNPNKTYLITAGFEGSLVINNLSTASQPLRMKIFKGRPITKMFFLKHFIVALSNDAGEICFVEYPKAKVIKTITTTNNRINDMSVGKDGQYLYAGSKDGKVALVELKNLSLVTNKLISTGYTITSLSSNANSDFLFLSTENKELLLYKMHDDNDMKDLVDTGKYKEAYDLANDNFLLKESEQYKRLEDIWNERFIKAFKSLCAKYTKQAIELLEPFSEVKEKSSIINTLLRDFNNYDVLEEAIRDKNYMKAYAIIDRTEYLKNTPIFKSLESRWEKLYKAALDVMIKEINEPKAKAYLMEFYKVPNKVAVINNLLRNRVLFMEMLNTITAKNFKKFFGIIAKNKFLKDTPEYRQVIDFGNKLLEIVNRKIDNRQYSEVLKEIALLMQFPHLEEKVKSIKEFADYASRFFDAYNVHNVIVCYKLIDEFPLLMGFDEARKLERDWSEIVYNAEELAARGDVASIRNIFCHYMDIESRRPKIGELCKIAYLAQFRKAILLEYKNEDAYKDAVVKYIFIFGFDDDMEEIVDELKNDFGINLMLGENQKDKERQVDWYNITKGNFPDRLQPKRIGVDVRFFPRFQATSKNHI